VSDLATESAALYRQFAEFSTPPRCPIAECLPSRHEMIEAILDEGALHSAASIMRAIAA
jgi:hypothetical protein